MQANRRSPLKDKPLRVPGQSLEEERRRLFEDKIESWLLAGVLFAAFAALEWLRYVQPREPKPWLFTVAALVPLSVVAWRVARLRPRIRQLKLGLQGERAVGQFLERLREQGYQVFHDIPGVGFNVDHVCIGRAGVFTIETKTWSKPIGRDARIRYDGTRLDVDGMSLDRDPLQQALAQSRWLERLLEESTGRRPPVKPVVLFPGWFVEADSHAQQSLWVLEPKALPKFLDNEPQRLSTEDSRLFAFHLSRYVRSSQADTDNR